MADEAADAGAGQQGPPVKPETEETEGSPQKAEEPSAGSKRPAEGAPDATPPEAKLPRPATMPASGTTLPPTLPNPLPAQEGGAGNPPPHLPPMSTTVPTSLPFAVGGAGANLPGTAQSSSISLSPPLQTQGGSPGLPGSTLPNLQGGLSQSLPLQALQQQGLQSALQQPQQPLQSPQQMQGQPQALKAQPPAPAQPVNNIAMSAGAGYVVRAPSQTGPRPQQQVQQKQLKETDALEYLNQVKQQFGDNPEIYNKFLDIMKDFKSHAIDTQKVIERVSKLFAGHQPLILGFNTFLPSGYKIEVRTQVGAAPAQKKPAPEFDHAYSYVSKIKQRFANQQEVYQKFLQILQRYKEEGFAIAQVKAQVAELFAGHDDLLGEFGNFLPDPSNRSTPAQKQQKKPKTTGKLPAEPMSGAQQQQQVKPVGRKIVMNKQDDAEAAKEHALFEKLKKKLSAQGPNSYSDFLKCLSLYVQDVLTANELTTVLEDMMCGPGVREVYEEFKQFLGFRLDTGNKYKNNIPMSEIDFCNSQTAGVSYRSLPKDYPLPMCSGRTELCDQVLNDEWVSVPSGSEDYSYTHYRKNQYEESLFKCEDDRFELDMLIETNASTIRVVDPLLEEAEKDRSRANKLNINALKHIHLKAIERVYGDHGGEIVEHIKRAPRVALNVVLPRLRQKDEEWRKARRDMNKIWREVYKDNYYKSLDHRSFYFKQVDKKGLSPKAFLHEIRAAQDNAATDPNLSPLLTFNMPDNEIHHDILLVMQKSAASELFEVAEARVRKFFNVVLHVFMGLRDRNVDEIKGRTKLTKRDRREGRRTDGTDKNGGYLSLRTRKLDGYKDEEGKEGDEDGKEDEDEAMKDREDKAQVKAEGDKGHKGEGDAMDEDEKTDAPDESAKEDAAPAEREGGGGGLPEEEEEGDDDEDDLWQAVHCLPGFHPLQVELPEDNTAAFDQDLKNVGGSMRLFFGNLPFYVFFRLYQKLYQRLADARSLSNTMDARLAAEQAVVVKTEVMEEDKPEGEEAKDKPEEEEAQEALEKKEEAPKQTTYSKFMDMLISLVEGGLDNGKFEDDCRMLLGTNSYELYTLDKVVEKLLGQAQSLTSEASTQSGARLLALHEYEQIRDQEISYPLYRANAASLTDGDGCFAFYYDQAKGALTVQLIDYKDSTKIDPRTERRREDFFDEMLGSQAAKPKDKGEEGGEEEEAEKPADAPRLPFMRRCVRGVEIDPDNIVEHHGLEMQYGDERIAYIKYTEEVMHQIKRPQVTYAVESRAAKVRKWQEIRLEKIPAEAAEEEEMRKAAEEAERAAAEEAEAAEEEEEEQDGDGDGEEEGEGEGEGELEEQEGDGDNEEGEEDNEDGEDEEGDGDGEEEGGGGAGVGGLESLMQAGEQEEGEGMDEDGEGDEGQNQRSGSAMEVDEDRGEDKEEAPKEDKEEKPKRGKEEDKAAAQSGSAKEEAKKEEDPKAEAADAAAAAGESKEGGEESRGRGGRRSARARKV